MGLIACNILCLKDNPIVSMHILIKDLSNQINTNIQFLYAVKQAQYSFTFNYKAKLNRSNIIIRSFTMMCTYIVCFTYYVYKH